MSKLIRVIGASKNSAEVEAGAATLTIGKVNGKLKVVSKYPSECRISKKLMHEAYVAAAEEIKKAQQ